MLQIKGIARQLLGFVNNLKTALKKLSSLNKSQIKLILCLGILLFIVCTADIHQITHFGQFSTLNTSIQGVSFSNKSRVEISSALENIYKHKQVIFKTRDDEEIAYSLEDLMAEIDVNNQVDKVFNEYSFIDKIVPFSFTKIQSINDSPSVHISAKDDFILKDKEAVNASLYVDGSTILVHNSEIGTIVNEKAVLEKIEKLQLDLRYDAVISDAEIEAVSPAVTTEKASEVATRFMHNLSEGVQISLDGKDVASFSAGELLQLFDINGIELNLNHDRTRALLLSKTDIGSKLLAPRNTRINVVDDVEVGRQEGSQGWDINWDTLYSSLNSLSETAVRNIALSGHAVGYGQSVSRSYTSGYLANKAVATAYSYLTDKNNAYLWALTRWRTPDAQQGYLNPAYAAAFHRAGESGLYADCGNFIATVFRTSGADTSYSTAVTSGQRAYLSRSSKWQSIPNTGNLGALMPGDVFVNSGHTFMYLGSGQAAHARLDLALPYAFPIMKPTAGYIDWAWADTLPWEEEMRIGMEHDGQFNGGIWASADGQPYSIFRLK